MGATKFVGKQNWAFEVVENGGNGPQAGVVMLLNPNAAGFALISASRRE